MESLGTKLSVAFLKSAINYIIELLMQQIMEFHNIEKG